jgi:hypothetical protein
MSEVKSPLELALEKQAQQKKEEEEAKERKRNTGSFDWEDVEYFALEDKKYKVCRVLGLPAELREKPTDPKFVLQSEILRDNKKSYLKVNWPIVERDGKMVPDPDWILTRLMNKVKEGKWQKYEDNKIDEKGKSGKWVNFHTETSIFKRIEGNSKPNEKYPRNFYPSMKAVANVIDRHDDWCKENKHSKSIMAGVNPYTFTNDKDEDQTIYYTKLLPKQCYSEIVSHLNNCIGVKSLSDIDIVIYKDSKADGFQKYWCFDKTDYPKYLKDETAHKLANEEPLTKEELEYELYDLDKFYGVTSYASLKRNIVAIFKLCDAELNTSFEKELDALCKEEAANRPQQESIREDEDKDEERYSSLDEEIEESIDNSEREKTVSEAKSEEKSIKELCNLNFPSWDKLSKNEQEIMIESIDHFEGVIPKYKSEIEDALCAVKTCFFPDTEEPTSYPESPREVKTCPVCGDKID